MALPSTPGAHHWNNEFVAVREALNAIPDDEFDEFTSPQFAVNFALKDADSTWDEKLRSIYFVAPMDAVVYQLVVSAIGLSGNTLTLTLSPAVPEDATDYGQETLEQAFAQGKTADYPSVSLTTTATGDQRTLDGMPDANGKTFELRRGRRYKLVATFSSGTTQPYSSFAASFMTRGVRV